jgi:hypothetical protein
MKASRSLHSRQLKNQGGIAGRSAAIGKTGSTEIKNEAGALWGHSETRRHEFTRGARERWQTE